MSTSQESSIDEIVPSVPREKGPSVREYFLYCVFNRMVEARSKNKLAEWYSKTAIQHIRPVEIEELTSMRYWGECLLTHRTRGNYWGKERAGSLTTPPQPASRLTRWMPS